MAAIKIIKTNDNLIQFEILIFDSKYNNLFRFDDGMYLPTCDKLNKIIYNLESNIEFVEYLSSFIYPRECAKYNIYFNNKMVSFDNFTIPIYLILNDLIMLIKLMYNIRKKSDDKNLLL